MLVFVFFLLFLVTYCIVISGYMDVYNIYTIYAYIYTRINVCLCVYESVCALCQCPGIYCLEVSSCVTYPFRFPVVEVKVRSRFGFTFSNDTRSLRGFLLVYTVISDRPVNYRIIMCGKTSNRWFSLVCMKVLASDLYVYYIYVYVQDDCAYWCVCGRYTIKWFRVSFFMNRQSVCTLNANHIRV